jgi:hypothetical protein
MSGKGDHQTGLWDEQDGFFYDALHTPDNRVRPLKVRSLVGLLPLFAVAILEPECLDDNEDFHRRLRWFVKNRPSLTGNMASVDLPGVGVRVLHRLLDEEEFLSPFGIRSLSKVHLEQPYTFQLKDDVHTVTYQPAESETWLFGGNSNWRGPIWFPTNHLIIESLRAFHRYYGDGLTVECPTGSGQTMTLAEVADFISQRLCRLFLPDESGQCPVFGRRAIFHQDPHWQGLTLFYEYFQAENGAGLGASHQTGWTGLVANLLQERGSAGPIEGNL